MRIIILLVIVCLVVTSSKCQELKVVHGTVQDASGIVQPGISVTAEGSSFGTTTNVKGAFQLSLVPGRYVLKFSSTGFETFRQPIELVADSLVLNVKLSESLYELPEVIIERETMTGGALFLNEVPGAAHYIGPRELQKFNYTDVNRILRNIPGINLQEEDGFGLRPNIGMRGTGVERSSKITLMEDGILMAPAPYTAPAAYYFPTAGRMQGVEVRKGSSQIKYGPYTTGGAINFISASIPQDFSARMSITAGSFGKRTAQAYVGKSFKHGGFMVETFQNSSDGFKKLDNDGPTGFINQDYIAKFRVNTASGAKVYQALTFKIGQTTSKSDETYLGLSEDDFNATPYRRYFASQMDNIQTDHHQYSVKYNIIPSDFIDISITAYRNDFSRNWYKVDQVKYGTSSKIGIAAVLDDPQTYQNEFAILSGNNSPNADALYVRNNNRKYYGQGIQGIIGLNFSNELAKHEIETGFRIHRDEEDRFQWDDVYAMENGVMKLTTQGTPGTESNRVSDATSFAGFIQYDFTYGKFSALPGLRYEHMAFTRDDFGKADPTRTGAALNSTENKVDVWIPGVGLQYDFTGSVNGFVGVHRGFAPPGATEGASPENSINYEIGSHLNAKTIHGQAVLFFNDYQNLLGSDLAAGGGSGSGDQFNAGDAITYGAEVEFSHSLKIGKLSHFSFPISMAYTYTNGEFQSSFTAANEDWGAVKDGDKIPYLANHQMVFNVGLQHTAFDINVSTKYASEMRTAPGQGEIPANRSIEHNFIVDLSTNYSITRYITAFGSVNNLFDDVYVVARRPAGLRPGMPRAFQVGLKVNL